MIFYLDFILSLLLPVVIKTRHSWNIVLTRGCSSWNMGKIWAHSSHYCCLNQMKECVLLVIVVISGNITNRNLNLFPYNSHHHTVITLRWNHYDLRKGEIRYVKNEVIRRRIVASIVSVFFRFSGEQLVKSGSFLGYKHQHPKGNHPSKFQLIRVRRLWGDSEQTDIQTH